MEADWSVEIGPGTPVIDPLWPGLIDLLSSPHRILEIEEAEHFPPLAQALLAINQHNSRNLQSQKILQEKKQENQLANEPETGQFAPSYAFWTVKCDLWHSEEGSWDPDEMDASEEDAHASLACYIDLLPRLIPSPATASPTRLLFSTWQSAEQSAKSLALALRVQPLRCARADLIVRSAITSACEGFAITAYLTACGPTPSTASNNLAAALKALTRTLANFPEPSPAETLMPLQ